jgi:hypothetical protein
MPPRALAQVLASPLTLASLPPYNPAEHHPAGLQSDGLWLRFRATRNATSHQVGGVEPCVCESTAQGGDLPMHPQPSMRDPPVAHGPAHLCKP